MRVTILHQAVDPDASEAEKDVLLQAESIAESLQRLGHAVQTAEVTLDLEQARLDLVATDPDRIFYLVESLDGTDSLAHLPAFLLETMQIPYTGAPAAALVLTNNKVRAKRLMALAGLPTPPWLEASQSHRSKRPCATACSQAVPDNSHCLQAGTGTEREDSQSGAGLPFPATFIIKPIDEHASRGMTDNCVVQASDERQLRDKLQEQSDRVDCSCFAERFIDGREFNLAVLGTPDGPIVLPPAEIDFTSFPPGKPHIVGYDAKWVSDSFEFENTPRCFPCGPSGEDFELGQQLTGLARRCWEVFGLRGYARVDFRVDHDGNPWILEINANPCLSPDAGFVAALQEAEIPLDQAVQSILDDT
jgi:D-alanine-D-alanine ligase